MFPTVQLHVPRIAYPMFLQAFNEIDSPLPYLQDRIKRVFE